MIPTSQLTLQDADILDLATEELWLGVVPFMMKVRSEYFITSSDTSIVANQAAYPIPTRAMGGKLAYLNIVDANGNLFDCPEIEKPEAMFYAASAGVNNTWVFYFEGNNVVIVPSPTNATGCSIRFSYYMRVGDLVATSSTGQVSAIDTNAHTVTISGSSIPSSFTTGTLLDMINGNPGFDFRTTDATITNVSGQVLTFASLPSTLAIGDWLAVAGESPIPQVPPELHPLLAQRTVVKVLEALGDIQAMQTAEGKLEKMEQNALHLISPRSDGNPKKLNNRYSTLRSLRGMNFVRY